MVSTHQTADSAFATLEEYAIRPDEQGIRPDAIPLSSSTSTGGE
ncbi:MAG: hypothetical protein ABJA98_21330 [Acidobacteriota bacterium]